MLQLTLADSYNDVHKWEFWKELKNYKTSSKPV